MLEGKGMSSIKRPNDPRPERYLMHLEEVRRNGCGEDDAENQELGRCVAAAIPHDRLLVGSASALQRTACLIPGCARWCVRFALRLLR